MGGGKTGSQFSVHHALSVKVTDYARKVRHLQEICKGRGEDFYLLSLNDNSPGLTTDGQIHPSPRALSSPSITGESVSRGLTYSLSPCYVRCLDKLDMTDTMFIY